MKQKSTGLRHTALVGSTGRSNARSSSDKRSPRRYPFYAICIDNRGNEASLMLGKAYCIIKPEKNDPGHRIRVIDEEGEDYLYGVEQFVPIDLPEKARKALAAIR